MVQLEVTLFESYQKYTMALKLLSIAAVLVVTHAGDLDFGYQGESYASYAVPSLPYNTPSIGAYSTPILTKYPAPITTYAGESPILTKYVDPQITYAAQAPIVTKTIVEEASPAAYDFEYAIDDPHSGDSKTQQESRRGDVVQGRYSLIEPDGTKRTVEYVADQNGFNAVVHKEPLSHGTPVGIKTLASTASYAAAPAFSYAATPAIARVGAPIGGYGTAPVFGYTSAPSIAKISAPAYGYSSLSSLGYTGKIYSPGPTVYSPSYGYH